MMKQKIHEILLVDDDAITNFCNEELLKKQGIAKQIHAVCSGEQAIQFIKKNWLTRNYYPKRLILLDINMKGMSGFDFLENLEKLMLNGNIQVAILTCSDLNKDRVRASYYHIVDYIEKPLDPQKLENLLDRYYHIHSYA